MVKGGLVSSLHAPVTTLLLSFNLCWNSSLPKAVSDPGDRHDIFCQQLPANYGLSLTLKSSGVTESAPASCQLWVGAHTTHVSLKKHYQPRAACTHTNRRVESSKCTETFSPLERSCWLQGMASNRLGLARLLNLYMTSRSS